MVVCGGVWVGGCVCAHMRAFEGGLAFVGLSP